MFKRTLLPYVQALSRKYPVVTLLGPRQSGKTTLAKLAFPHKPYVNLEDAEHRALATTDPKGFMEQYPDGALFDEVQRAPHLLSFIQVHVDACGQPGMYILTGSHQADLHHAITQSLAGRTSLLRLLPLSLQELRAHGCAEPFEEILLRGGYPRIYKDNLPLTNAFSSYFQTYVERDVRHILQIKDISAFERFIKLIASRVGGLINYASLAADVGVSAVTIKEWISVLEATYILVRLEPYFDNFGKRLIKSPKIYFTDTGLLCYLLGISTKEHLVKDALYGNIFENGIVLELMKCCYHTAEEPHLYFYRDVAGHEVDLIRQQGSSLIPIEIKSGKTFSVDLIKGLQHFHQAAGSRAKGGALIYAGTQSQVIAPFRLLTPDTCSEIL